MLFDPEGISTVEHNTVSGSTAGHGKLAKNATEFEVIPFGQLGEDVGRSTSDAARLELPSRFDLPRCMPCARFFEATSGHHNYG